MATQGYRLVSYLYVNPVEAAPMAQKDLQDICSLDDSWKALNPFIELTNVPGQLRIQFTFSASGLEEAEEISKASIERLLVFGEPTDSQELHYIPTQGSDTLSFA